MNTIKNKNVIFDVDFSDYLISENTKDGKKFCQSLQEVEDCMFDNFESFYQYIDDKYIDENIEEAKAYIKKEYQATPEEMGIIEEEIKSDLKRALADTYDGNYMNEWIKKYKSQLENHIIKQLPEEAKIITDFDNIDIWEKKTFKVLIPLAIVKEIENNNGYKEGYYTQNELLDTYLDEVIRNEASEMSAEYIDYYGTLGDFDGWFSYFQDYHEESREALEGYRQEEKDKKENPERLKSDINDIINQAIKIANNHEKDKNLKNNILRNLKSIRKIIE